MKSYLYTLVLVFASIMTYGQVKEIVIIDENDFTEPTGKLLGSISFKDKIFTSNCSYPEVMAVLTKKALAKGANVLKVREHKVPDVMSTCHRVTADMYAVDDIEPYRKEIQWVDSRKLNWQDFKATSKPTEILTDAAACTYCGFGFETNRVTLFKKTKFFIYNKFYCDKSWKSEAVAGASNDVLQHEQTHFDLSEVYARKLSRALTEAGLTMANLNEANNIYNTIRDEYVNRQQAYDMETQHGKNQKSQLEWNDRISQELDELANYKNYQ